MKSKLAKDRDQWFESDEGNKCCDLHTLSEAQYLRNRLEKAFLAGAKAGEKIAIGDSVLMPKELTAENGAKALMIGEFRESVPVPCLDCIEVSDKDYCETCGGERELWMDVYVSWPTIKTLYQKAVKHLGKYSDAS